MPGREKSTMSWQRFLTCFFFAETEFGHPVKKTFTPSYLEQTCRILFHMFCQHDVRLVVFQHQAMKRHNEAWQDSLRYRRPDLDLMSLIGCVSAPGHEAPQRGLAGQSALSPS